MSLVTNVIVLPGSQQPDSSGIGDRDSVRGLIDREQELLRLLQGTYEPGENYRGQCLKEITTGYTLGAPTPKGDGKDRCLWGGTKFPECDVFAAAFNYIDWDKFKAWVEALPWLAYDQVRVLRMGEEDRAFEVWIFCPDPKYPRTLTRVLDGRSW